MSLRDASPFFNTNPQIHSHTCVQSNEGLTNEFSEQINYILHTHLCARRLHPQMTEEMSENFQREFWFFFLIYH